MASGPNGEVARVLRSLCRLGAVGDHSDGRLLERFFDGDGDTTGVVPAVVGGLEGGVLKVMFPTRLRAAAAVLMAAAVAAGGEFLTRGILAHDAPAAAAAPWDGHPAGGPGPWHVDRLDLGVLHTRGGPRASLRSSSRGSRTWGSGSTSRRPTS